MGNQKKIICVLGMHRSGTSALTRVLNLLGVYLGKNEEMMPASNDNAEGFWEHLEIVLIHDQILRLFHAAWDNIRFLPDDWRSTPELIPLKKRLIEIVTDQLLDHDIWGFKDPRTCLLIPLWQEISEELAIPIEFIHVYRNPLEIAGSLSNRNGFSVTKVLALWYIYSVHEYYHTMHTDSLQVNYGELMKCDPEFIVDLAKKTGLNIPNESLLEVIASFLNPSLRHHKEDNSLELYKFSKIHDLDELIRMYHINHSQFQEQISFIYHEWVSYHALLTYEPAHPSVQLFYSKEEDNNFSESNSLLICKRIGFGG